MNNPLVSIIVPVYNVEKYIRNCIESVLRQSYSNWELILVDDGSPDNCPDICDEYAEKDSRIKVIHKENGGLSSARNAGMRLMTGDYATFLDSDDFLHTDFLRILVDYATQYSADIVQCDFIRGDDTIFPVQNCKEILNEYDNHTIFTSFAAKIIMCCKIYKRELLDGIIIPEGIINEDDWTTWKIYYKAVKTVVTNRPLYYYTVNPNSIMGQAPKNPDFTYLNAYKERISFFAEAKEVALEHCSHLQLCKSLLLTYGNPNLSKEDRRMVKSRFNESYLAIAMSNYVSIKMKTLFTCFFLFPMAMSKMTLSFIHRSMTEKPNS